MSEPTATNTFSLPVAGRSIVFVSIGTCLIIGSAFAGQHKYDWFESALLNLGVVAIAVVLVDLLWRCSGGNPTDREIQRLQSQIERLSETIDVIEGSKGVGLDAVHDRLGDFGNQSDWIALLRDAQQNVDLMGRTMFGWVQSPELQDVIVSAIKERNVTFRWLIMDESNKYLSMLIEDGVEIDKVLCEKIKAVLQRLGNIRSQLPTNRQKNLKIRTFAHVPLYGSIVRVDDKYYSAPYLCSASSNNCPMFAVTGANKSWPKIYDREFTTIWNAAIDKTSDASPVAPNEQVSEETTLKGGEAESWNK